MQDDNDDIDDDHDSTYDSNDYDDNSTHTDEDDFQYEEEESVENNIEDDQQEDSITTVPLDPAGVNNADAIEENQSQGDTSVDEDNISTSVHAENGLTQANENTVNTEAATGDITYDDNEDMNYEGQTDILNEEDQQEQTAGVADPENDLNQRYGTRNHSYNLHPC